MGELKRPEKICDNCDGKTTNYYPVPKSKEGAVRCEDCHMRSLRSMDGYDIRQV